MAAHLKAAQHPLENQSGREPYRGVIQADHAVDLETASAVIPGTEMKGLQERAGHIFYSKNAYHIDQASEQDVQRFYHLVKRNDGGRQAIDGKHPEGRAACKLPVSPQQRFQACPEYFHAPADEAAFDECQHEITSGNKTVKLPSGKERQIAVSVPQRSECYAGKKWKKLEKQIRDFSC